MKLTLLSLTLSNFKGAKFREINFNPDITNIYGRNRTGKTTTFDAYKYVMTGKNSQEVTQFEIKPLDENNVPLRRAEYSVTAVMMEDDMKQKFTRTMREKWTKPRGQEEEVYSGDVTDYFYNDVQINKAGYEEKLASIISEPMLKLLSDPYYFNNMNWVDRRRGLFSMVSHITDESIAAGNPDFEEIIKNQKDLEQYKRMLAAHRKQYEEKRAEYPIRINELQQQIEKWRESVEPEAELREAIEKINQEIAVIDDSLADINKTLQLRNEEKIRRNNELNGAKTALANFEFKKKQEFQFAQNEKRQALINIEASLSNAKRKVENINNSINMENLTLQTRENKLKELRQNYDKKDTEVMPPFNEEDLKCKLCMRLLEGNDLDAVKEKLTSDYNSKKAKALVDLQTEGKNANALVTQKKQEIEVLNAQLKNAEAIVQEASDKLAVAKAESGEVKVFDIEEVKLTSEWLELNQKVIDLSIAPSEDEGKIDNTEIIENRKSLYAQVEACKKKLAVHDSIANTNERINELIEKEKALIQEIADVERNENILSEFTRHKINTIEESLNSMFTGVTFKMYDRLNSGELRECCETLVNGVPFPDVNTADQVNAGLSIINTFSLHYNIYAPIFIDQAEGVNELIPTASQMIRLVVTEDPELVIS